MKIDPISIHERALIIRHLAEHGTWEATRSGRHVRIVRYKTPRGSQVHYSVNLRTALTVSARAHTVADAIREINTTLSGGPRPVAPRRRRPHFTRTPIPQPYAAPHPEWLPYKDA